MEYFWNAALSQYLYVSERMELTNILGWTESFCVFQMTSQSFFKIHLLYLISYIISIACYYRLPTCHKLFNSCLVKTSWFAYVISSKTQKLYVQPSRYTETSARSEIKHEWKVLIEKRSLLFSEYWWKCSRVHEERNVCLIIPAAPYRLLVVYKRIGVTCCLDLQGWSDACL
jgi:hypothetical protein